MGHLTFWVKNASIALIQKVGKPFFAKSIDICMADNTTINKPKTAGAEIATDYINGVHHQRVKIEYGEDGSATDVSNTNPLPVAIGDKLSVTVGGANDTSVDAFSRLRVSNPVTLFESKQLYDKQPLVWAELTAGSASSAHDPNLAATTMTLGTSTNDRIVRQSKMYVPYQPGKSFFVMMTGIMGSLKTNVTQRIGYFDDNNGLFFEQNGTVLRVVRRTKTSGSIVDNAVNQSSWNLDKLDGTGASGITLDTSKVQIFLIDFQWLGSGRVRFGFFIDGVIVYCHEMLHANNISTVFMSTPTLPLRYEILNTGTTGSGTSLVHICATVLSEGGYSLTGSPRAADRNVTYTSAINSTLTPLISVRLKSTYIRATATDFHSDILEDKWAAFRWCILLNPTITGGSAPIWNSSTNSIMEYDIAQNGSVSGGTILASGVALSGYSTIVVNSNIESYSLAADVSGVSDILVLAVQGIATVNGGTSYDNNQSYVAAMRWKEYV